MTKDGWIDDAIYPPAAAAATKVLANQLPIGRYVPLFYPVQLDSIGLRIGKQ